jgi:hypothetical protein
MSYFHKKLLNFYLIISHAIKNGYKKKMEQILEEELEALSKGYMERIIEEFLPSRMEAMDISIPKTKSERPLEDQEVIPAYYYHSH